MTTPRPPRPVPGGPQRPRPTDDRSQLATTSRTTRRIAIIAIVLALVGVGFAAWRTVMPTDGGCQTTAWDTKPNTEELPDGWTVSSSQYDIGRKQMTLLGPAPSDESASQPVVYATVTCYPQGAADSVSRSAEAAASAGQTVSTKTGLGEQGFSAVDDSGAAFVQFRHGNVVVYIAASGDATTDEVEAVATAFDRSMGGAGIAEAIGTPDTGGASPSDDESSPGASDEASPDESAVAPELESKLPTKVGTTELTIQSALGDTVLADDAGSRAIIAALRAVGKEQTDFRVAQAYDANDPNNLSLTAIGVSGMKIDALEKLVLDSWLTASGAGVKRDKVTLGGHEFTRVDYGDEGVLDYVLAAGDHVLIIETADADVAAQAAAALP